jgi:hypothetical protein
MSAADEIARLRAEADALERVSGLEVAMQEAKQAYQADKTPELKAAYQSAAQEFADARSEHRASKTVVSAERGGVTIVPGNVAVKGAVS